MGRKPPAIRMLRSSLQPAPQRLQGIKPVSPARERTRGRAWMSARDRVMRRDCGLCQTCLRAGRLRAAVQVDHIVELADGGTDDEANLEAICHACHASKTAASQARRRAGG